MAYAPYTDENGDYTIPGQVPAGPSYINSTQLPDVTPPDATAQVPNPMDQQPAGLSPASKPQDPYATPNGQGQAAVTPPQPRLDDMSQAQANVDKSINKYQQDSANLEASKMEAQTGVINRQADAQSTYADNLGKIDQQHAADRARIEQQNAAEMAGYMQTMDSLGRQEPNRGRYWENQSSFGKAMWLLGVGATAIANSGHPGMANQVTEMLQKEIEADVSSQKERIARQMDVGKLKGTIIQKQQDQRLTDLHDDYAKMITRYGAVRDAAVTKAAAYPPGTQLNLAWQQAAAQADTLRTQTMQTREQEKHQEKIQAATQAAENARAAAQRQLERDLHNQTDRRERDLKAAELQKDYDLAHLSAKMGANASGNPMGEGAISIPTESGFGVQPKNTGYSIPTVSVDENGVPKVNQTGGQYVRRLNVQKDQVKEATDQVAEYAGQLAALRKLRETVADSSKFARLIDTDPELKSARTEAGAAIAKSLNGGRGPLNENDQARGEQVATGLTEDIFKNIRSGADRKTALKMLDERIDQVGKTAKYQMMSRFGTDIKDNEELVFNPDKAYSAVHGQAASEQTPSEAETRAGKPQELVVPKSTEDVRTIRAQEGVFKDKIMPELPDKLQELVSDAHDNMVGGDFDHIKRIAIGTLSDFAEYEKKHPEQKALINQARLEVQADGEDASTASAKLGEAKGRALQLAMRKGHDPSAVAESVQTALDEYNLSNNSAVSKRKLAAEITRTLDDYAASVRKNAHFGDASDKLLPAGYSLDE